MCILFVYINPHPRKDQYKVVLVNNRDESYARTTKNAHKWGGNPQIIAGEDLMPGREGGTWLGVASNGKIANLLNVLQPPEESLKHKELSSRGFLAVNYLRGSKPATEYLSDLAASGIEYNKFNLVLLEPEYHSQNTSGTATDYQLFGYNSSKKQTTAYGPGVHAFSNSYLDRPFKKQSAGKKALEEIIEDIGPFIEKQDMLMDSLFQMMRNTDTNLPDEVMAAQGSGHPEVMLKYLSRIYVTSPNSAYGTRTTTVVLVDCNNKATIRERTMRFPCNARDPQWDDTLLTMNLS